MVLVQRTSITMTAATLSKPYAPETISEDKRVCRFMWATYYSRPPPRKLKPIWDMATVLRHIETWSDMSIYRVPG